MYDKKVILISPGGFKGFYELGILSFIKENYNLDKFLFSGASAGAWNSLFMCYKNDSKQLVYNILDYKTTQSISVKDLQYFLKYKLLTKYKTEDFDLRRLFIGVTTIKKCKTQINIFSDFNSLEDAINCCMASSHIPFITGYLTNIYRDKYTFDGGFSTYPYLNISNSVLHVSPEMWDKINNKHNLYTSLIEKVKVLNDIYSLTEKSKNSYFIELYERGYEDAKKNKHILDKIFF